MSTEDLHFYRIDGTDSNGNEWRVLGHGQDFKEARQHARTNLKAVEGSVGNIQKIRVVTKVETY